MSGRIHSLINVYLCLVAILATRILGLEELLEESPYAYRWNHEKYSYYAIGFQDVHVDDVASILGATYIGPIGTLEGYHLFKAYKNDDTVLGQYYRLLRRRSRLSKRAMYVVDAIHHISSQQPKKIYRRGIVPISNLVQQQEKIIQSLDIRDPGYWLQWHLFNSELPGNDINVTGVWQQNITGKGVVVALVDDGIDFTSNDIKDNFFAEGSFDYNDHVKLPMPRTPEDIHGTRCAGEVAAVRNHLCGVGIAYESKVAGIRILSKEISDIDEALSLNYGYQVNDIYSCSWGPPDDGRSLDGPHEIVEKAIINGVQNGRQGKGTIFVFASGNGGAFDDHCNCDGYTNSIYSITVGAIDRYNQHPYYSEACSAVMVVTYSSGSGSFIYTTDRGNDKCTDRHGGTSAAAPLAAGIYALVLSVRPDLTWRDMQHLTVRTAIPVNLEDESWSKTAAGWMHSNKFGFGKLDSFRIVEAAKTHQLVGRQVWIHCPFVEVQQPIPVGENGINSTISVTREMADRYGFRRTEHVTVVVNIAHERRGHIEVFLISPHQVVSQLSARRKYDESPEGFNYWRFMTVKHWDEDPVGDWTLMVRDTMSRAPSGIFMNWSMTVWGEGPSSEDSNETTTTLPTTPPTLNSIIQGQFDTNTTDDTSSNRIGITPVNASPERDHFIAYAVFGVVFALCIAGGAYWAKRRFYDRRHGYGGDSYEFQALQQDADDGPTGIIQQARHYVTTRELYEAFGEDDTEMEDDVSDQDTSTRQPIRQGELVYENEAFTLDSNASSSDDDAS